MVNNHLWHLKSYVQVIKHNFKRISVFKNKSKVYNEIFEVKIQLLLGVGINIWQFENVRIIL